MAPLLLGTAATTAGVAGATTTAAATAGLFGTAGAFALAPTALTVGTGIAVAGQLQAGQAAKTQEKSAENIAAFNVAVQEREAKAIKERTIFAGKRQAKKAAEIKSALTAKLGAAGGLGSLVAADLAAEQAAELELEGLLIGFEGEELAGRALSQAEIDRLSGRVAKRRGKAAVSASRIRAGGTLLTGFGRTFER